jgi:hypothetical protein
MMEQEEGLTIEELKKIPGFESMSDADAEYAIQSIHIFCTLCIEIYLKQELKKKKFASI